jgi:wyosine [tRNA(Phe)-imidazoG37] synthetase (radical SAM superfamily)
MEYVFGPVPSRRLGQSLGIDTIPLKTCNWNCVYCQLGRTVPLTNQRQEYYPREKILLEIRQALEAHTAGGIDWITFVGSGEPTLHSGLGWLIQEVKGLTDLPVAVITNGSTLYQQELRNDLGAADAVLPTLDAGKPWLYQKINRPHPEITLERLLEGMRAFRDGYAGQLWVEVMLVCGLNDTEIALADIAAALQTIQPDEIHLNLPTRPPAETWVRPTDDAGLLRAQAILGETARVVHPASGSFDVSGAADLNEAIVGILTRHPMREDELIRTLNDSHQDVNQALSRLAASGRAQVVERYGVRFWGGPGTVFPDETHSQRTSPGSSRKSNRN